MILNFDIQFRSGIKVIINLGRLFIYIKQYRKKNENVKCFFTYIKLYFILYSVIR